MFVVTGATGKLGRHVVKGLLERVPAKDLRVAVRDPGKATDLAAAGVDVRRADYNDTAALVEAFVGADRLLLISSSGVGRRLAHHRAVVDAAVKAGVGHIAYTSILRAPTTPIALAGEHRQTEALIAATGKPFVFLRNGWYIENHTDQLPIILQHGTIAAAAGDGRFASATRADYAAAAVAVLTTPGHDGKAYELAGDQPFTLAELAAEISKQAGRPVSYTNLSPAQYREVLVGAGLPDAYADILVDADVHASGGALDDSSGDLRRLIGRPTTTVPAAVAEALAALSVGRPKEGR